MRDIESMSYMANGPASMDLKAVDSVAAGLGKFFPSSLGSGGQDIWDGLKAHSL